MPQVILYDTPETTGAPRTPRGHPEVKVKVKGHSGHGVSGHQVWVAQVQGQGRGGPPKSLCTRRPVRTSGPEQY